LKKGLVIKSTGSWYIVKDDEGTLFECKIKGKLRIKDLKTTNPVAIGDIVAFEHLAKDNVSRKMNLGIIISVDERKNYIIRKSQNLSKQAHIIAANVDQAFLVATVSYPVTTTTFMDRYLASAEAYRIPVIMVFNKTDRYDDEQMAVLTEWTGIYQKIGYPCIHTSMVNNSGIAELTELMRGKISVFNGHSGVGKTTIINTVQPGLNLRTSEISDSHERGKHTTTHSELFELDFGGYIIDTPGIKAFGMLEMDSWEISHYFKEIFKISSLCQYNNCSHTHEPGCAVKNAVENGGISESRYISYIGMLEGDQKYRPAY
jgi:ribosome biogenesis GTPase / thiamine phosphate phosphatase